MSTIHCAMSSQGGHWPCRNDNNNTQMAAGLVNTNLILKEIYSFPVVNVTFKYIATGMRYILYGKWCYICVLLSLKMGGVADHCLTNKASSPSETNTNTH